MTIDKPEKTKTRTATSEKSCWFLFFYWIIFYLLLFSIFFVKASTELDPDFGWHLIIGKEISNERQAPTIEKITYPTLGQDWVDHEWLSNFLMYSIYSWGGVYGNWFLSFVFSLLLLGTFYLSIKSTEKYLLQKISPVQSAFFISLSILAALYPILIFFGNRIQVLSWFLLSLFFFIFGKIFTEGKYALLFVFPLLLALWTNLHGSFIFGLGAVIVFCILLFWHAKTTKQKIIIIFAIFTSLLATLLTPYHIELWELVAGEYASNRSYLKNIIEWLPIYSPFRILWIPSLYIALFVILLLFSRPKKILATRGIVFYFLFCLLTLILAIKARRFIPFFAFSSLPLIALFLKNIFLKPFFAKKTLVFLLLPFFVLTIFFCFENIPLQKDIFSIQSQVSPKNAVDFIKSDEKLANLRIFNDYNWGGYLAWVWPEKQIFIDGRMPQKPLANGLTFFEEYLQFHQKSTLESKLGEYSVEMVLIQNKRQFSFKSTTEKFLYEKFFFLTEDDFRQDHFLIDYLEKNWSKIYEDRESLVFIKHNIN